PMPAASCALLRSALENPEPLISFTSITKRVGCKSMGAAKPLSAYFALPIFLWRTGNACSRLFCTIEHLANPITSHQTAAILLIAHQHHTGRLRGTLQFPHVGQQLFNNADDRTTYVIHLT